MRGWAGISIALAVAGHPAAGQQMAGAEALGQTLQFVDQSFATEGEAHAPGQAIELVHGRSPGEN